MGKFVRKCCLFIFGARQLFSCGGDKARDWRLREMFIYLLKSLKIPLEKNSCTQGAREERRWHNPNCIFLRFFFTLAIQRSTMQSMYISQTREWKEQRDGICFRFVFIVKFKILFFFWWWWNAKKGKRTSLCFVCAVWFLITFNDIFYAKFCIQLKFICLIKFPSAAIPRIPTCISSLQIYSSLFGFACNMEKLFIGNQCQV